MKNIFLAAGIAALTMATASAQTPAKYFNKPYQQKALEIYRTAVSYRTALWHALTPELAAYLADQFREGGFDDKDIHVISFDTTDEPTSALVVRYPGDGSSGKKPILFVAHLDVVEALEDDWERDPFTLTEEDGYFFGRGAQDDKFGVAALTATFLRLKSEGFTPSRDLVIAFTADEETKMITTRALVDEYRELTDAEFALNADAGGGVLDENGQATSYLFQAAEKTYATFELTVRNPGGHSSTPRIDNAIYDLAAALGRLEDHRFPVRHNDLTTAFFAATAKVTTGEVSKAMKRFAANPHNQWASDILWAQPEHVGVTRTTCIATMLRSGHAENALPQSATATVNCRIFPGISIKETEETLRKVLANNEIEINVLDEPKASPASPLKEDVVAAVTKAVHARYPGIPVIPYMAPYGTDGLEIRSAGIPTYGVIGNFLKASDEFAHGLNERVPVKSFFGALEHWHIIIEELAGKDQTPS